MCMPHVLCVCVCMSQCTDVVNLACETPCQSGVMRVFVNSDIVNSLSIQLQGCVRFSFGLRVVDCLRWSLRHDKRGITLLLVMVLCSFVHITVCVSLLIFRQFTVLLIVMQFTYCVSEYTCTCEMTATCSANYCVHSLDSAHASCQVVCEACLLLVTFEVEVAHD